MKKQPNATAIYRCPKTDEQLSYEETMNSRGICPRCGDIRGIITHRKVVSGYWWMPTLWERLRGIKPVFQPIESTIK